MSGGYLKSLEVKEEVVLSLKGSGLGGIRGLVDRGGGLPGLGSVFATLQIRYVGDVSTH